MLLIPQSRVRTSSGDSIKCLVSGNVPSSMLHWDLSRRNWAFRSLGGKERDRSTRSIYSAAASRSYPRRQRRGVEGTGWALAPRTTGCHTTVALMDREYKRVQGYFATGQTRRTLGEFARIKDLRWTAPKSAMGGGNQGGSLDVEGGCRT